MSSELRPEEELKFRLLADGIALAPDVREVLAAEAETARLTPADYASTSGLILRLGDDVWVNAPIVDHNPNFVGTSEHDLLVTVDGLVVRGPAAECRASFWVPPRYHGEADAQGTPWNNAVFTHGDRVRVSPIRGCHMTCKFCNVPFEDRYATKPVSSLIAALDVALHDERQPARHILISGGTPRPEDHGYLRQAYRSILTAFPQVDVDIMMVPAPGLLDVRELAELGVHELSINLELFDEGAARRLMPHKFRHGRDDYLAFIGRAADELGPGRVRSMLMVGLEPMAQTLAGVQAIVERGAVPVLSPFRPDPATPLRATRPPTAVELRETYLRAEELAGAALGPTCPPCTHNTLTFPSRRATSSASPACDSLTML